MEIIIDAPTPELKEAMEKKIAAHLESLDEVIKKSQENANE